jgi:hypothetical protein
VYQPYDRREFFGIRGFFCCGALLSGKKHSFFTRGLGERLRSLGETASYGSNSAVDSPGAAMSAFKGRDEYERASAQAAAS